MAENGENATVAVPPNSETNTVVETTEIMETLPVSEISQGTENSTMDIVSMALSNVTETANLMTVVDSNVVTEDVEVQQFEQVEAVEVVEQQVVQEIPIGSEDMVITTADGQIILPSNSTPAELSAVETLVGGALQQTVLSQPVTMSMAHHVVEQIEQVQVESSSQEATVVSAVPVVESSTPGIVNLGGGAQGISASSLLGSIATMIDSTESSIQHVQAGGPSSSLQLAGLKINTTSAGGVGENIIHRTVPANNVNLVVSSVEQAVVNMVNNTTATNNNSTSGTTMTTTAVSSPNVTTMGLKSMLAPPSQSSSLPSTITIKTPPGSNSVSQSLLNSILNNSDVHSLLRRNPGQPITIVRVPEDSPGGKNVNKITVTTGPVSTPAPVKKPPYQPMTQAAKTYMRITTPGSKSSPTTVKSQPNTPNNSNPKRRPGRPPKVREPPPEPIVVKSKKTRSGRVSRPPIHRVRDYKTIHIQEMGEPDDEKDDFTDYDGELLKNPPADGFTTYAGRPRDFRCEKCDKAYIGKAGLGRHFKNNPDHGDPADLGITYDDEEEKSEQGTPAKTVQMPPIRRKRRGRPPAPRPPNGDPDFLPNKRTPMKAGPAGKPVIDLGAQALHRRKQRIQELIKTIGDEDLMELALPRLSKAITVWEFLLMKVEEAHLQKLPFQEILQHFESVRKLVRLFANECLERVSAKCDKQDNAGVQSDKNTQENHDAAAASSSKSDEVPSSSDKEEKLTDDSVAMETDDTVAKKSADDSVAKKSADDSVAKETDDDSVAKETDDTVAKKTADDDQQNNKDNEPSPDDGSKSTEIPAKTTSNLETESPTPESDAKVTENGEANSESEQPSESKVDESTSRTDDDKDTNESGKETDKKEDKETDRTEVKETDRTEVKETDKKEDKETDRTEIKETDKKEGKENDSEVSKSASVSSADDVENTASKSSTEIATDFLELDDEIAKVLGMEVGRYSIRDWTSTKLPAMFRFSKKVEEEEDDSPSEEEPEDGEPAVKRRRMDEASTTMTSPVSSSTTLQKGKQVTRIPPMTMPALSPAPPGSKMQLVVHNNTSEYKPATVPMSLKAVEPVSAGGDANATSTANKQQQQQQQQVVEQTVTSPTPIAVTAIQQVEEEPQPMEMEQSNEASKSEETTEATVEYQTEEQNQSMDGIVPEGSTIMQMEDGTFLVQKPDGTAMQIHCPDGMTIETIQALLSMDAGNILQAAE